MARLKQSFQNHSDRPQFIMLELSTARFRVGPGEELILHYDSDKVQDQQGSTLRVDLVEAGDYVELSVWTAEDEMYLPDGRRAPMNYDTC